MFYFSSFFELTIQFLIRIPRCISFRCILRLENAENFHAKLYVVPILLCRCFDWEDFDSIFHTFSDNSGKIVYVKSISWFKTFKTTITTREWMGIVYTVRCAEHVLFTSFGHTSLNCAIQNRIGIVNGFPNRDI